MSKAIHTTKAAAVDRDDPRERVIDNQHRADARVLMAVQEAVIDATERTMPRSRLATHREFFNRIRSHINVVRAWSAGSPCPALAKRFADLFEDGMNQCCSCGGKKSCNSCFASAALCREFNGIAPIEALWTALGWAAGVKAYRNHTLAMVLDGLDFEMRQLEVELDRPVTRVRNAVDEALESLCASASVSSAA